MSDAPMIPLLRHEQGYHGPYEVETATGLRVLRCCSEGCDSLPKYRESDPVNAPGHYERIWEPGWCQCESAFEKNPNADLEVASAPETANTLKGSKPSKLPRDIRTRWRLESNGEYRAWMGNMMYAVVRPLVRHEYARPRRKGRDVRYWIGGVVAAGYGDATVDVRGFQHGYEVKLLTEAKRRALQEAESVGLAIVHITAEHGLVPWKP